MIITTTKIEELENTEIARLMAKTELIERDHKDYKVKLENLIITPSLDIQLGSDKYHISEYALSQLCGKIGVPVTYIKKCAESGKLDLARNNLLRWMDSPKSLMVRTYGNSVRGILSDRYSILDNRELLNNLVDTVDLNKFSVKGAYLDTDRLHMRLVSKDKIDIDGEDLFAGIQVDNSDIGKSSLNIKYLIYKQVCTNGLVLPRGEGVLFRQKHIGISNQEFKESLSRSLDILPDLIAKTKDLVDINRSIKLTQDELDVALDKIKKETNLSEDNIEVMKELTTTRYGMNNWGLVNSITEIAQKYTLDRRLELEKYSSKLLVA